MTDGGTPIAVTGNITANNASVGANGTTAPTSATEIGGVNPEGKLTPVSVTDSGAINVVGDLTVSEGFETISVGPTQISIGTVSTQLLAANANRLYAHIINNTSNEIYIQYSSAAALNQGLKLQAGGTLFVSGGDLWLGAVNAIALMPNQLIDVLECT